MDEKKVIEKILADVKAVCDGIVRYWSSPAGMARTLLTLTSISNIPSSPKEKEAEDEQ